MNPRYTTASQNGTDMPQRVIFVLVLLQKVGKPGVSNPWRVLAEQPNDNPSVIHKLQIELRWIGKLPGNPRRVRIPGKAGNFHRIKVDEEAGYVINTFTNGGLVVSDIRDHSILWSLDEVF